MNDLIKYGFSLGRVSVLEDAFLSENQIERLLEAENLAEKLQVLEETIYGEFLGTVTSEDDIEESLANYISAFSKLLRELGTKNISRYFELKYDISNLSSYYQKRLELAKKIAIPLIWQLSQAEIDLANIRTWWKSPKRLTKEFIKGGKIEKATFMSEDSAKHIVQLYPSLEKILKEDANLLDKDLDNCIIAIISKQIYEPLSANRLIAFLKAKEIELKNVRLVLFAGLNNFSSEITADNLRYAYA